MSDKRQGVRRKYRKYMLFLLAIGLLFTLALPACSQSNTGGDSSGTTAGSGSQSAGEQTGSTGQQAATQEEAAPKTIRFLGSHGASKYTMQYNPSDDPYLQELAKLSGYDIQYEFLGHGPDYIQQLTLRFASNDLADVVRTDSILSSIHPGAVEQGVFHELGPLLDQYGPNIKKNVPQAAWDSARITKDGKIYGIPVILPISNFVAVYIRKDWLDKLQMKQPVTVDDYVAFFEAVKKEDVNGNGDPNDEYGFYVRENLAYSELFFKETGGYHLREWDYRDGLLQPAYILPEMKEAVRFWKNMYENGYVNPNLFTNPRSDWIAGIKQGLGGIWTHDSQSYTDTWHPSLFVNEQNVQIDLVEAPVGPGGPGGLTVQNEAIEYVWVIPASNPHPEEVIKYMDWAWSSPEAAKFFAYGIEGLNYTVENGAVKYDASSPVNAAENNPAEFFRIFINPVKISTLDTFVLDLDPNAELVKKGIAAAQKGTFTTDSFHMPVLEAMTTNPELGFGANTLFLDMFAQVLTGKADVDAGFDNFVAEWRSRGGDQAIQEATAWYKQFHKIN